jgi:hypothetical protein
LTIFIINLLTGLKNTQTSHETYKHNLPLQTAYYAVGSGAGSAARAQSDVFMPFSRPYSNINGRYSHKVAIALK